MNNICIYSVRDQKISHIIIAIIAINITIYHHLSVCRLLLMLIITIVLTILIMFMACFELCKDMLRIPSTRRGGGGRARGGRGGGEGEGG